jgi:CBS domain-containing protein
MAAGVMGVFVKDIMYPAHKADQNTSIEDIAKFMLEHNIASVFVEADWRIKGIVTERDIVRKVVAKRLDPASVCLRDIMSSPVISVSPDTNLQDASELMAKHKIRRLAVVENGRIIGKVTANLISQNMSHYLNTKLFHYEKVWRNID